jgi:hypothetical protein
MVSSNERRHFDDGFERHVLGGAEAWNRGNFFHRRRKQAMQVSEARDHLASELDRALARDARAQKDSQQLRLRQRRGAVFEQALPRSLVFWPVA